MRSPIEAGRRRPLDAAYRAHQRLAAAHHEAGHAAAAFHCRVGIREVSIRRDDARGTIGHMRHTAMIRRIRAHAPKRPFLARRLAEKLALISLAGRAAQVRFSPSDARRHPSRADRRHVLEAVEAVSRSEAEARAYLRLLHVRAAQFVRQEVVWAQIEVLVQRLCQDDAIDGREAVALLRSVCLPDERFI